MYGIFGGGLSHTVHINNTKHMSAVILSAVDDRTMRNHQPLGRYSKGCVHTQSDVLGIVLSHFEALSDLANRIAREM